MSETSNDFTTISLNVFFIIQVGKKLETQVGQRV